MFHSFKNETPKMVSHSSWAQPGTTGSLGPTKARVGLTWAHVGPGLVLSPHMFHLAYGSKFNDLMKLTARHIKIIRKIRRYHEHNT